MGAEIMARGFHIQPALGMLRAGFEFAVFVERERIRVRRSSLSAAGPDPLGEKVLSRTACRKLRPAERRVIFAVRGITRAENTDLYSLGQGHRMWTFIVTSGETGGVRGAISPS